MAGLSIKRRRKARLDGVIAGARGKGRCRLVLQTLKQIYQRGLAYGQENAEAPAFRAMVEELLTKRDRGPRPRQRGGRDYSMFRPRAGLREGRPQRSSRRFP